MVGKRYEKCENIQSRNFLSNSDIKMKQAWPLTKKWRIGTRDRNYK